MKKIQLFLWTCLVASIYSSSVLAVECDNWMAKGICLSIADGNVPDNEIIGGYVACQDQQTAVMDDYLLQVTQQNIDAGIIRVPLSNGCFSHTGVQLRLRFVTKKSIVSFYDVCASDYHMDPSQAIALQFSNTPQGNTCTFLYLPDPSEAPNGPATNKYDSRNGLGP